MSIRQALESLPQREVVIQTDAARWLAGVMRWHADRAPWHAKRLRGFGGSEIGAIVRGIQDLKGSGFNTLPSVVEGKLLKRLPSVANDHMKRGTVLEHLARLAFLYRYKASQDLGAIDAISAAKPKPGYEWLIGNPDDLVVIRGKRWLNDYKVPSTYSEEIDFDYEAQLHHYELQCRFAGVKVEGLLLTKLDLAPELAASLVQKVPTMTEAELHDLAKSIAQTNVPGFRVVGHVLDSKRDMHLDILDCGHHAWHEMVMKGIVPDLGKSEKLALDDKVLIDVARYQQQYAMAKAGIAHLNEIAASAEKAISAHLEGVDFEGKAMPLSLVNVIPNGYDKDALVDAALQRGATEDELASEKAGYSAVALLEEIKRLNGDPEAAHLFERKLDPKKAETYLQAAGADLDEFRKPGVSLRMSTKKESKELAGAFQRSAGDVFNHWLDDYSVSGGGEDGMEAIETPNEVATGTPQEAYASASSVVAEEIEPTQRPTKSAGLR